MKIVRMIWKVDDKFLLKKLKLMLMKLACYFLKLVQKKAMVSGTFSLRLVRMHLLTYYYMKRKALNNNFMNYFTAKKIPLELMMSPRPRNQIVNGGPSLVGREVGSGGPNPGTNG